MWLISDLQQEVLPGPTGSTATWWWIPLARGWPSGSQTRTPAQGWNPGSAHPEQDDQFDRVSLSEFQFPHLKVETVIPAFGEFCDDPMS